MQVKPKIFANREYRRVGKNIVSLSVLQAANYLLPLITLPYLTRVLGVERFGLISFVQGIMAYLIMFTDFGFNLSATKSISIHRDNREKIQKIFFSVLSVKLLLYAVALFFITFLVLYIPPFAYERQSYLIIVGGVFGLVIFPQWFFQGIEEMWIITAINLLVKAIATSCIFFFVRESADYNLVLLLTSAGYLVAGFLSLILAFRRFGIRKYYPSLSDVKEQFMLGWHIFVSHIAINLYTTSNVVVLGLLTNNFIVGIYSAAERIFKAFQFLAMPVYQALFPHFSKLIAEARAKALNRFRRIFRITLIVAAFAAAGLYLSSDFIISIIIGSGFEQSGGYLRLLAWIIIFAWGNYYLGIHGLVNFGFEKQFSHIVILFGVLHVLILVPGIHLLGPFSVPVIWLWTELGIFFTILSFLRKQGILH